MDIIIWEITLVDVKKTVSCLFLLVISMGYDVIRSILGDPFGRNLLCFFRDNRVCVKYWEYQ